MPWKRVFVICRAVSISIFFGFLTLKNTMSPPFGHSVFIWKNASERTRRKRFRSTARGRCFLPKEKPRRGAELPAKYRQPISLKKRGLPKRKTLSKSSFFRKRKPFFNIFYATVSFFLPSLRCRATTFLPPTVLIRFKNPCRLARLRVFGW